ncbi:hypothetical protein ACFVZW_12150 [Streptomyces sp. NPDC059567]|uniref:hypothetical protein n=1 Tax=Streptomyces sp. NPDC059567 TaxID=3346867 RepID=UPI0036BC4F7D
MRMQELVSQVFIKAARQYFADSPMGMSSIPAVHPPAQGRELGELERRIGEPLEPSYRDFLRVTDGMDGFSVVILGCHDWEPGGLGGEAAVYLADLVDIGVPGDVGIPDGVSLFPVAFSRDASEAIFMADFGLGISPRFWWAGEGDSLFFDDFYVLLKYMSDPASYDPIESLNY